MRDYYFCSADGKYTNVPVAESPLAEILRALRDREFRSEVSMPAVIERLRLELFIRENNLRAVS